jgi:hypothetical protein
VAIRIQRDSKKKVIANISEVLTQVKEELGMNGKPKSAPKSAKRVSAPRTPNKSRPVTPIPVEEGEKYIA